MTDMTELEYLETETGENPVGCVIWMHGLGADASDFEPIVPMLPLNQPLRFVFPNAPIRPITVNGGAEMRGWYDIDPSSSVVGGDDINESAAAIKALVENEIANGFKSNQIVLAGFSQGGVIALELGLSTDHKMAGIMALSTYVHDHQRLTDRVGFANIDTPIFMASMTRSFQLRAPLLHAKHYWIWPTLLNGKSTPWVTRFARKKLHI